jgi:hypothetical protein
MRRIRALTASIVVTLGVIGAVVAFQIYRSSSSAPVNLPQVKRERVERPVIPTIVPGVRFEWAPCKPTAVQRGRKCVVGSRPRG